MHGISQVFWSTASETGFLSHYSPPIPLPFPLRALFLYPSCRCCVTHTKIKGSGNELTEMRAGSGWERLWPQTPQSPQEGAFRQKLSEGEVGPAEGASDPLTTIGRWAVIRKTLFPPNPQKASIKKWRHSFCHNVPSPATFIATKHGPTLPVSFTPTSLVPSFVDSVPLTGCLSGHVLSTYYVSGLLRAGNSETRKT